MIRHMLLIDDDLHQRKSASQALELGGYQVESYGDPRLALKRIGRGFPGAVISDMRMPGMTGLDVLRKIRRMDNGLPVILITGYGDVPMAVKAMKAGAFDFIEKPFSTEVLVEIARRACETRSLVLENRHLRDVLMRQPKDELFIIGVSDAIAQLRNFILEASGNPVPVLISGEVGCEHEAVARSLHREIHGSSRDPFIIVRCDELKESFAESEIFGHKRVRAEAQGKGAVHKAERGMLYLERVDRLPTSVLNRVFSQLITSKMEDGAPRIVFSMDGSGDGHGGESQMARSFPGVLLTIPPVRTRGQDRLHLFRHFAETAASRLRRRMPELSQIDITAILGHDWPGNVAELRAVAERFVLGLGLGDGVYSDGVSSEMIMPGALPDQVAGFEQALIERALRGSDGSIKLTYESLGIPRKTLQDKMKKYRLDRSDFVGRKV